MRPPFDPCGMVMDYGRVAGVALMRFTANRLEVPCPVRFYFVPNDTPVFPYPTPFCAYHWWQPIREYQDHGPGLVYNSWKIRANRPGPIAGKFQRPCGTAKEWLNGVKWPYVGVTYDANGHANCCANPPPILRLTWGVSSPILTPNRIVELDTGSTLDWDVRMHSGGRWRSHLHVSWKTTMTRTRSPLADLSQRLQFAVQFQRPPFDAGQSLVTAWDVTFSTSNVH